jgi:hypothetical protein
MPFAVNCPVCGVDGTPLANELLGRNFSEQPAIAPAPVSTAAGSGLRIQRAAPAPVVAPPPLPVAPRSAPKQPPAPAGAAARPKATGEFNLGLGILGALLGAGLGAGLMYMFYWWADFRFPLMGTGIGVLAGLGARLLYRGTDVTLGAITAAIALLANLGTLYFMFGDFAFMYILSLIVSVSVAYKIAG